MNHCTMVAVAGAFSSHSNDTLSPTVTFVLLGHTVMLSTLGVSYTPACVL